MVKRFLVAIFLFVVIMSLVVFLTPQLREMIRTEYLTRRYPDIPESELTVGSNKSQTTLSDGSTYFVSNGRQFYVDGVKSRVVFPDGREEIWYLGSVTLLPNGQVVDLRGRQITISQGSDQEIVTVPDGASIQKQTISFASKPADTAFSEISPATLEDIQVGDVLQLIEGKTATLTIIKTVQK